MGRHTIVTVDGSVHLALDDDDVAVLDQLDGRRAVAELIEIHGPNAEDLLDDLAAAGIIEGCPPPELPKLSLSRFGIEFAGFDRLVARVDRLLSRLAPSHVALPVGAAAIVAGSLALVHGSSGRASFSATWSLAILLVWTVVSGFLHELAHALVIHRAGRRVGRAGLGLHWGDVAFFVDATDALFLPRRQRVVQSLAGPFADAVLAGSLGVAAWLVGSQPASVLLVQMAVISWLAVLVNLCPLLELDGQRALEDLLDEIDLHGESMAALRRMRHARDRRTLLLAGYAMLAVVLGTLSIFGSVAIWLAVLGPLVVDATRSGWSGCLVAAAFVAPAAVSVAAWTWHRLVRTSARFTSSASRRADHTGEEVIT